MSKSERAALIVALLLCLGTAAYLFVNLGCSTSTPC